MTREELAARIYSVLAAEVLYEGDPDHVIRPSECFRAADAFLAYAAKQREPARSGLSKSQQACEHRWVESTTGGGITHCILCGAPYSKPEPPVESGSGKTQQPVETSKGKPNERVAREWEVTVSEHGYIIDKRFQFNPISTGKKVIKVREILPGDEHDK